jgi:hypothetical protein
MFTKSDSALGGSVLQFAKAIDKKAAAAQPVPQQARLTSGARS